MSSLTANMHPLNKSFEQIEAGVLNPVGYVPVASTVSGAFRVALAIIQIAMSFIARESRQITLADHHMTNAFGNLARGFVEMIPVVNLMTLLYDHNTAYSKSSAHRPMSNISQVLPATA